jgi:hypothetical protein
MPTVGSKIVKQVLRNTEADTMMFAASLHALARTIYRENPKPFLRKGINEPCAIKQIAGALERRVKRHELVFDRPQGAYRLETDEERAFRLDERRKFRRPNPFPYGYRNRRLRRPFVPNAA